ncbi:alpha/beta-hydrolase [Hymenopellis radicata]|nr:alpha/beta-hydrolase [Hymenopellis radicata]
MLFARLVFVCSLAPFFLPTAGSDTFVVDTGYAKYLGNHTLPNTVAYLGIPYAEPPLADRRFRAPLPLNTTRITLESGHRPIDARSYPDFCIQGTVSGTFGGAGSEDCLKINIYAPTSGNNFPVLVYFHGGGYIRGNPANFPFDHWIEQSPDIVAVTVYYRLSSFGFLATPEFNDSSNGDFNAGFLDQLEALRWVRQHIASFGGDPSKVTINGQSAGGGSVELHLIANHGSERLFSSAVPQSIYRTPMPLPELCTPLFDFFAQEAGCGDGAVKSRLACLRSAPLSALTRAQDLPSLNRTLFPGPYYEFHPVIDSNVFTETPTRSLLSGIFAKVPVLVGATSNETGPATSGDIVTAMKAMYPGLSDEDTEEFIKVYPASDFASDEQRLRTITGESRFRCGQTIVGDAFSRNGVDTWAYRYNQPNPSVGGEPGVVEHAAENWMMFRGSNTGINGTGTFTPMTDAENAFAAELIAYWISFVRSGNPNTFKLDRSPVWTGFNDAGNLGRIVLQQTEVIGGSGSFVENEPAKEAARCAFVAGKAGAEQN